MAAGVYDIYIEQGATFILDVTYTEDGVTPVDLTGYLGRGQVKVKATDTTVLADITVTVSVPLEGAVAIRIPATVTTLIPLTGKTYKEKLSAVYDVELYKDEEVIRLLNGVASISPEITK